MWPSAIVAVNRYPFLVSTDPPQATAKANGGTGVTTPGSADQVRVNAVARSVRDHDEITVTIDVAKGYHVNANPASFDYLIPTSFAVDGVAGPRVTYPAATLIRPRFAPEGLNVYEGTVTLTATMPKGKLADVNPIRAELRVQACTDEICLPPATLPLVVSRR
jgi:hypothetical protein